MKLKELIKELDNIYNPECAEDWDNIGLLVGNENSEINKILFCLDVTMEVVDEAINKNINLIISHHPLIFGGIKKINNKSILGEKLIKLIENKIAVFSAHTNADFAENGLNDFILSKIIDKGNIEIRNQIRLKELEKETTLEELIEKIKKELRLDFVRYVGDKNKKIKKAAIITGGGSSFINEVDKDIDVFLTGDLKYHESLDAYEENKTLIDIGHYESEYLFVEMMEEKLKNIFNGEMIKYYGNPVFKLG